MYVVPYLMGPPGSPMTKVGIELTDSIYVALSMGIMTRMGTVAFEQLGESDEFNRGLHCMLDVNPERRLHRAFPAGQCHHLGRLQLRRQRAAGQEVPGTANRFLPGQAGRLDGRAHAHPVHRIAQRAKRPTSRPLSPAPAARPISP